MKLATTFLTTGKSRDFYNQRKLYVGEELKYGQCESAKIPN